MEISIEIIIYSALSVLTLVGTYVSSVSYMNKKVKECKIIEIEDFYTTHEVETGLCTMDYTTKEGSGKIIDNNILIKFAMDKVGPGNLFLVREKDKDSALIANSSIITLNDSKISPINSSCFYYSTYLFLIASLCTLNLNLDGPISSLVFLVVIFLASVIANFVGETKIFKLIKN